MRCELGIVLATMLGLAGCGSGPNGAASGDVSPPILQPTTAPNPDLGDTYVNFDFLGPVTVHDGRPEIWTGIDWMPFASCYAPFDWVVATCADSIWLDDGLPPDDSLRDGQIVEIHGSRLRTALAASREAMGNIDVAIRRTVIGPIEAIDADRGWLTVLGQRIYVSDSAVATYAPGDVVTVYGDFTADGQIVASLIEPYQGDPVFLLRGVLSEPSAGKFAIGSLEVDLSSATRENFPGGAPIPGDAVLVVANQQPDRGILPVDTVRCTGRCAEVIWTDTWENGSVRGFVTGWRSATDFDVDGRALDLKWCECVYQQRIPLGSFVEVHLSAGNAEVVRADSTSGTILVAGPITAIDATYREIVVLGYRVQVTPATQLAAGPEIHFDSSLSFDDLRVGDSISIYSHSNGAGIRAGSIVRQGSGNFLRAFVFTIVQPGIEIAGRTILTDSATEVNRCMGGGPMTLEQFFATPWSDVDTSISLVVADPFAEPLVAREITVCG